MYLQSGWETREVIEDGQNATVTRRLGHDGRHVRGTKLTGLTEHARSAKCGQNTEMHRSSQLMSATSSTHLRHSRSRQPSLHDHELACTNTCTYCALSLCKRKRTTCTQILPEKLKITSRYCLMHWVDAETSCKHKHTAFLPSGEFCSCTENATM